jgi:hypothetical protein
MYTTPYIIEVGAGMDFQIVRAIYISWMTKSVSTLYIYLLFE